MKKAVEEKESSTTDRSKLIAKPIWTWQLKQRRPGASSVMDCSLTVSFVDERKGAVIGEGCGRFQST